MHIFFGAVSMRKEKKMKMKRKMKGNEILAQ
jgi:hypothetical protein